MKICFMGKLPSAHTERRVNYFAERGHKTYLISFHGTTSKLNDNVETIHIPIDLHEEFDGLRVPISRIPSTLLKFKKLVNKTKKTINKINPDILHSFGITNYGVLGALTDYHPFIISSMGSDLARTPDSSLLFKYLTYYVFKKADKIHVQDPLSKLKVKEFGIKNNKIYINSWGVDIKHYSPNDLDKEHDIICIRKWDKNHNVEMLIKAIPLVKNRFPDIDVILLGKGNLENELKNLAKKLGVFENIHFKGWVDQKEIPHFFNKSKICVDTSYIIKDNEIGHAYGVGLRQAMSCGIPTVVGDRPTISKLDGQDKWYFGLTYKGNNPKDLAKKIIKLLNNEKLRYEISMKNREVVSEKFEIDNNIKEMIKMYRKTKENQK